MFGALIFILVLTCGQYASSTSVPGPNMEFHPMPPANLNSTLIWSKSEERDISVYWTNKLDDFLKVYHIPGLTPGRGQNIVNCDYDHYPKHDEVCDEDVKTWAPCINESFYNYQTSAPCIFLKLNQISGWVPEFYNDTENLPSSMPQDLKDYIVAVKNVNRKKLNTVWVSCEGVSPADVENIRRIQYLPDRRGFPGYFYPFKNQQGYLPPLVAIQLQAFRGIIVQVKCKAWAKNIDHNRTNGNGVVDFELLVD